MRRRVSAAQQQFAELASWREGMNPEQLQVIDHGEGPIVVQAVAGSGKTRALVHRIARLVQERGVDGERVCAVTFSTDAAGVMNTRLDSLDVSTARVGTWHSLALQILREDETPYANWKIDDRDRHKVIVKRVLGYEYLDWDDADFRQVRSFITICKANFWAPDDPAAKLLAKSMFAGDQKLALDAYTISQNLVERERLLTFDDFLVFAARHLSKEENRKRWASRWDYLNVDEFQDNSRVQNIIAEALARDHRNYCAIGDRFQALYSFRGASPRFIMDFEKEWGARRVAMIRNYRSGKKIIAVANAIIVNAAGRPAETMVAERGIEGEVHAVAVDNYDDEGGRVAVWAQQHLAAGRDLGTLAVLYRTNAQSRAVEEALLKVKIPYRILGGLTFYDRKEVKDLLGYLRVAAGREGAGDDDGDAIRRCINAPFRYLGSAFVKRVMQTANGRTDWLNVVREVAEQDGVSNRARSSAISWATIMTSAASMSSGGKTPAEILNWIVDKTNYIAAVEKEEGQESIETSGGANVREMIRVASSFDTVDQLLDFVDRTIVEARRQRRDRSKSNRVLLMSIHRSKAKEFPHVWIIGCNEGTLPHGKGDPEEERRVAYVAVTRAMDTLTLSYVEKFTSKTGERKGFPSRFLIEAGLVASTAGRPTG